MKPALQQPEPTNTDAPATRSGDHEPAPSLLAPFDPAVFNRQIALANAYHRVAVALTAVAFAAVFLLPMLGLPETQRLPALVAVVLVPLLWLPLSMVTTRVARALPAIGAHIGPHPAQAERLLKEQLDRKPVMRWARLLTYHRLATLRHRQRRFDETADICQHLLNQPMNGPASIARPHLLLMLAEAQLCRDNLPGAYYALGQLHKTRLSLTDAIQRLALQTRYALKVGDWAHALDHGRAKVELAELMPPPQCGAMHAMLATAARKQGRAPLADWLWERAELITPPALLQQLRDGAFDVDVVQADDPAHEA